LEQGLPKSVYLAYPLKFQPDMEYGKIIAVTGLPGLYELVSSKSDGAIVRSLDDKTTRFVSSRVHNFSHLESIEIYTVRDNVNLAEIFQAMQNSGEKLPDGKDNGALKKYFEKAYPDLDFERVYASDMKKMVKWLGVLQANDVEIKLREAGEEPTEEVAAPVEEPAAEEPVKAPAKKAATKAAAKKEKPAEEAAEPAEKPKKKAAPKAKKEEAGEEPAKKKAAPKKSTKK
jgi:chemotaxis protein histidine kinase CheA